MSTEQRNSERSTLVAQLRIQRDLKSIEESHDSTIVFASQSDGDSLHIEAGITGPLSTSYENGTFLVNLKLPETYPYSPPSSIIFKHAIMHPNVNEWGNFMSFILKEESWSPCLTIKDILEHIWNIMAIPEFSSCEWDPSRAELYRTNKEEFERRAREYSTKYTIPV